MAQATLTPIAFRRVPRSQSTVLALSSVDGADANPADDSTAETWPLVVSKDADAGGDSAAANGTLRFSRWWYLAAIPAIFVVPSRSRAKLLLSLRTQLQAGVNRDRVPLPLSKR